MSSEQLETRVAPQSLLELLLESKFLRLVPTRKLSCFAQQCQEGAFCGRQLAYLEIIVPRSSAKWRIISIVIALISTQNCAATAARV
jgi:hypothetical protein